MTFEPAGANVSVPMTSPPEVLTTPEAAEYLSLPVSTLERRRQNDRNATPESRRGPVWVQLTETKHVRYRIEDLREWVASRTPATKPEASGG